MTKPSRSILKARIRVLEAENARLRRRPMCRAVRSPTVVTTGRPSASKPSRSILKARIRVLEAENARLRRWEDRPGYTGPDGKVYTDEATVAGATKVKHEMLGRGEDR